MLDKANMNRFRFVMAADKACRNLPYDEVSVELICSLAGLSKSSFYRLFNSKSDVVDWWQKVSLESSFGQIGRTMNWRNGILASYDAWQMAPALNQASKTSGGMSRSTSTTMKELLLETLVEVKRIQPDDQLLFQLDFLAGSTVMNANSRWSWETSGLPVETLTDLLVSCIPHDLFEALDTPENPQPAETLRLSEIILRS